MGTNSDRFSPGGEAVEIAAVDPHSPDAMALIQRLAADLSRRYENDDGSGGFRPADATVPRSVFLVAYAAGRPVGCGALRPYDEATAEVKRMFVDAASRGRRIGAALLRELERRARTFKYACVILETGIRQPEAIRLYEREGYDRIPAFGRYVGNPLSVCFGKILPVPGGERDLDRLLVGLAPLLNAGEFVFGTLQSGALPAGLKPLGQFAEMEGETVIVERVAADAVGLEYQGIWRQITLQVHSSLEAVGLLAVVTRVLADAGIPCNAISAYHHDHLFVPAAQAERAVQILADLAKASE